MLLSSIVFGFGSTGVCVDGEMHSMYSVGVKTLDLQTHLNYFNSLAAFYKRFPAAAGSIWQIELFPTQAVKAVPNFVTVYPHRDIQFHE